MSTIPVTPTATRTETAPSAGGEPPAKAGHGPAIDVVAYTCSIVKEHPDGGLHREVRSNPPFAAALRRLTLGAGA